MEVQESISEFNNALLADVNFEKIVNYPSDVNNVMNGQGSFEKV